MLNLYILLSVTWKNLGFTVTWVISYQHFEIAVYSKNLTLNPETYKKILDILPKGKMIPTNVFQAEFMHYPKQQQCAIDLLEKMEDNGKPCFIF